jgi:transcriptional activator
MGSPPLRVAGHRPGTLIDARLALGERTALIPELETLVAEHPFNECMCDEIGCGL